MDLAPAPAPPLWDDEARATGLDIATTAMTRFARPDVDAATWWSDLSPLLSVTAQTAYVGTDPTAVPPRQVSGPATLLDDTSGTFLATVAVPTDVGTYVVLLSRHGSTGWLVERLDPPAVATGSPASLPGEQDGMQPNSVGPDPVPLVMHGAPSSPGGPTTASIAIGGGRA